MFEWKSVEVSKTIPRDDCTLYFQVFLHGTVEFSFWHWFLETAILIRKNLNKEWDSELIVGFMSKEQTEYSLTQKNQPHLLLRFSDSVLVVYRFHFNNVRLQLTSIKFRIFNSF